MLDPSSSGKVVAASAAAFLKKSQLRETVLHKVSCWREYAAQVLDARVMAVQLLADLELE